MRLLALTLGWLIGHCLAATRDEWRSQTIYQVITDRFSNPSSPPCNVHDATFCGGSWASITSRLDYISQMGFTAIWISPINKNYDGPRTAYGDAYHGYWVSNIGELNPCFGSEDDLRRLIAEVHKRNMLIMVDIVVNHVASTTIHPTDYSQYYFKQASQYHPYCPIDFTSLESEQKCWLGDDKVALMDVNTEDNGVISAYSTWIAKLVHDYKIDGLRIDAAKHVRADFWPGFCQAAGVFCMGEVFESEVNSAAVWQTPLPNGTGGPGSGDPSKGLDSILHFPLYKALLDSFTIPGKLNMSILALEVDEAKAKFADVGILGTFLENHDVPRWSGLSVDPQSLYNALAFLFTTDGIPIVYYGLEQFLKGGADPENREALWTVGYESNAAVELIKKLHKLRKWMITSSSKSKRSVVASPGAKRALFKDENIPREVVLVRNEPRVGFLESPTSVLGVTDNTIALFKGDVISILTNIGSPPQNMSAAVFTPYERNVATTDILTCTQYAVGSGGTVSVEYSKGGHPVILVPDAYLRGSGICDVIDPSIRALQSGMAYHANVNGLLLVISFGLGLWLIGVA